MKAKLKIRFHSGREERFSSDFVGGGAAGWRLTEFLNNPTVALKTRDELLIFPSTAIECISITLPPEKQRQTDLSNVRSAERIT